MEWWASVSLRELLWTAHGEAGFTLPFLPQASAGDIVFRRVSFSSVVLFLHLTSFVGCGAGVHVPHVEVVGSPLPTYQSRGLNSGLQARQQMFYPLSHLMSLPTLFYFSFLLVYSFILHIWVFACKCVCAWCLRSSKRAPDPLELKIQSRCWG